MKERNIVNRREGIPRWLNIIISLIAVFLMVFSGAWGGMRMFENNLVTKIQVLSEKVDRVEKEQRDCINDLKMADQHAFDVIEMNRQVRMEQLNTLNNKCDELKGLLEDLIDITNDRHYQ